MNRPSKNLAEENHQPAQAVRQALRSPARPASCHLILVLHGQELSAWQSLPDAHPRALLVKDESRLTVSSLEKLESAWADLDERLRGDGLVVDHVHWIADASARPWCAACAVKAAEAAEAAETAKADHRAHWQVLGWEWLAERFGLGAVSPWVAGDSFTGLIVPWLISATDAAQRQNLRRAREDEHASETDRLMEERLALEHENIHLRDQNAALQQVDLERLVSFLPALFPRVFTVIGPADVALLCGRVEPPSLPNPYPEPSEETLRTLQKRFRALPKDRQRQIVHFVAALPQRQKLEPRPEMREWVYELEGA